MFSPHSHREIGSALGVAIRRHRPDQPIRQRPTGCPAEHTDSTPRHSEPRNSSERPFTPKPATPSQTPWQPAIASSP